MPRLHQVSREDNDSPLVETMYGLLFGDRDPVAEPGTATGTPGDWWTVFANDHAVFEHAVQGFGVYRGAKLDPVLRELGQTRAGWLIGSQFYISFFICIAITTTPRKIIFRRFDVHHNPN